MSIVTDGKAWLRRMRKAAPLAWKHDRIFRWAVIVGGVALIELITQATQHPTPPPPVASNALPVPVPAPVHHARASAGSTSF